MKSHTKKCVCLHKQQHPRLRRIIIEEGKSSSFEMDLVTVQNGLKRFDNNTF